MAKSDRLINKWSGDSAFADTRLDDGLSSVIPKATSKEGTDLVKTQRAIGALGHMVLSASEGYSKLYDKMSDFVLRNIGPAATPNPEFDSTVKNNGSIPESIFADHQNKAYAEFQNIQRAWHIKMMAIWREKVITKIAKVNQKVANAVGKIPPSAHGMFGGDGDASELEKVVKLSKDLAGRHYNQPFQNSFASSTHKRGDGNPRGGRFTHRGSRGERHGQNSDLANAGPRPRGAPSLVILCSGLGCTPDITVNKEVLLPPEEVFSAGGLPRFREKWRSITTDPVTLDAVSGLTIPFKDLPPFRLPTREELSSV